MATLQDRLLAALAEVTAIAEDYIRADDMASHVARGATSNARGLLAEARGWMPIAGGSFMRFRVAGSWFVEPTPEGRWSIYNGTHRLPDTWATAEGAMTAADNLILETQT